MTAPGPHHAAALAAGARCDVCPLRNCGAGPVPPERGDGVFLVVGEFPSPAEVDEGRTAIGPTGREIRSALQVVGVSDRVPDYTNAILCRPPAGDLPAFERECKKRGQPSPVDCCAPRVKAEIARSPFTLYVGGTALEAADIRGSVMKLRGTPVPGGMATLSPGFVLRDAGRLMRGVFRHDVAKAVRFARGGNTWRDPDYWVPQNRFDLQAMLTKLAPSFEHPLAVDTETDGIDPWLCNIRRIGAGDGFRQIIFRPLSVNGQWLMPEPERNACWELWRNYFAQAVHYTFHNFYSYDSIVLAQHGVTVNETNLFDSLIGHHIGQTSEFPHGLDFLGSIYTDAPRWKDDVKHSTTKEDATLDRYLSFDIAVTGVAGPIVRASVERDQQGGIYSLDSSLAVVGRSMSRLGVAIHNETRSRFVEEYETKAEKLKAEFVDAAGRDVNPGSYPQLKRLFYQDFGLPVHDDHRTDTGEPSTGESALLDLLARGVDDRARRTIHALLGWREADKILGTYVGRNRTRKPESEDNGGLPCHADGRIRATWKVYGTTSGRWSSSPNLQNIPDKLRSMFVPAPGNVFVAADYSAVELRILALLANDEPLIRAFDELDRGVGPDIHTFNACGLFRCTPDKVTKEVRTFAKRFVYGLSYGAGPPKIFQTMSLLRDEETMAPVFPGLTLNDVEHAYKQWWKAHPALTAWRSELVKGWRRFGFIATPWHGRRRYFVGGENHEEMYNHPIQGAAADLQNTAVLTLTTRFPFDYSRCRGLVLQVHDQLVVECLESEAAAVKCVLAESMQRQVGPMRFPAEVKIGRNWKEV